MIFPAGHDGVRWVLRGDPERKPTEPNQADPGLTQRRQQAAGQGLLPGQPNAHTRQVQCKHRETK
jgi:hypothetical protein